MELVIVNDKHTAKQFLDVHVLLNKDIPGWVRPLDKDINAVFDTEKNKAFRHGELIRWLLKDDNGKLIGRIAAFVNKKYKSKGDTQPTGGVGFFDVINDQKAANFLFDSARDWLKERGMGAMDGPINFGERNNWWGLLVEGFHEPLYAMNFNPPYYKELMENYGFLPFFHQYCYGRGVREKVQEKFYNRHAAMAADPAFSSSHLKKNQMEKYVKDFVHVYNKAWAGHGGNKEMGFQQAMKLFKQMKPVMDEKIIWFIYHNNEPIGAWLNLPSLNEYFKHLNGKFGPLQILKLLWLKMTQGTKTFTGILFGIVPEFQGTGADAYLILEGGAIIQHKLQYEKYEMQWIGDFNPKMINMAEGLGTTVTRKLTTYRYLFDRTKEFKRHPQLG